MLDLDEIKREMKDSLGRVYPVAVPDVILRQLIRTYLMGVLDHHKRYIESLKNGFTEQLAAATEMGEFLLQLLPTAEEGWIPNDSWKWWIAETKHDPRNN